MDGTKAFKRRSAPLPGRFEALDECSEELPEALMGEEPGQMPELPVVRLHPVSEVAAAARRSPLFTELRRFAEWAVDRKLTETAALRTADLKLAVAEVPIPLSGHDVERLPKLRSAWDLPAFRWRWNVLQMSGLLEVGRHAATGPALRLLAEDDDEAVVLAWANALDGLIAVGAAGGDFDGAGPLSTGWINSQVQELLVEMYMGPPVSVAHMLQGHVRQAAVDSHVSEQEWRRVESETAAELRWTLDRLASLGAIEGRDEGYVLTPLGVYGVRYHLQRLGFEPPAIRDPSASSIAEVLAMTEAAGDNQSHQLVDEWLAARSAPDAATELISAASDGTLPRYLAFAILDRVGTEAEPVLRQALDAPELRPYAVPWLVSRGLPAPELGQTEFDWLIADMLSDLLGDDEAFTDAAIQHLGVVGSTAGQLALLDRLWRLDHPDVAEVLEGIDRLHPDKQLAKAARTAAFKARSVSPRH